MRKYQLYFLNYLLIIILNSFNREENNRFDSQFKSIVKQLTFFFFDKTTNFFTKPKNSYPVDNSGRLFMLKNHFKLYIIYICI